MRTKYFIILFLFLTLNSFAQTEFKDESIKNKLEIAVFEIPGLQNVIDISVEDITVSQFIQTIATKNKINVDVKQTITERISTTFSNIQVSELFLFLCERYNLDLNIENSILSFSARIEGELPEFVPVKELNIVFDPDQFLVSYDLRNDTLSQVTKKLTLYSGKNIVLSTDIFNKLVNGFAKDVSVRQGLEQLCYSNNLKLELLDSTTYTLSNASTNSIPVNSFQSNNVSGLKIRSMNGLLSIDANNVPISSIIESASKELKLNYFIISEIKGNASLKLTDVTYQDFLKAVLNGTENTFRKENNTFLIGDRNMEGIRTAKVIQIKNRTVDKVIEFIPSDIKKDIELKAFADLNSIIVCGASEQIKEIERFVFEIDKVVPVISIEVIIIDIRKNNTITTGIQAGLGKSPVESTYSSVFPNIDVNLNSNAVNNIITAINGLGIVNIGKVTPNFYLSLKASESNGILKIVSTPRLAALNGNEAKLKIGETRYYVEQTSNIITTQSTTTVSAIQYKPLQANLEIGIKPSVSAEEQITLDIDIQQSSFTDQLIKDGPFGSINRSFHSNIRVKNEEMVVLGGLSDKNMSENGTGTPFLSRIPVIRWLFSSRTRSQKKSNLIVLIKPTIYY